MTKTSPKNIAGSHSCLRNVKKNYFSHKINNSKMSFMI